MSDSNQGWAIVTGGNRGLGLATVDQLAQRGYRVILAARDLEAGEREAARLRAKGRKVVAMQLDVTDAQSMHAFAERLGGAVVDVIVSNAGVALDGFDVQVVDETFAVNYFGATRIVRALENRFRRGSRVVMVSSGMASLDGFDRRIRMRFANPQNERAIEEALAEFRELVCQGKEMTAGWPRSAYRVSKLALNAWTRLYAREVAPRGVLVNAVCPGWVRTRMGGAGASRSVHEGAAGIVWAATLPPNGPTGGFFRDGHPIPW
ncbi:MAG: SDR family NAD(P)-dependent oxidoreductase [Deltaproteobacteria bacterium]|nr:SDR family NAD(P)-dependent oxidoreductase [Deltaproteobacteria bacterium]